MNDEQERHSKTEAKEAGKGGSEAAALDQQIWGALKECYDPEIPVNIVDLGLVYQVKVDDEIPGEANVFVTMTLTAPGCGMGPVIAGDVKRRVQLVPGVRNVLVEVVFDPIWNPGMMSEAAKLQLNMF